MADSCTNPGRLFLSSVTGIWFSFYIPTDSFLFGFNLHLLFDVKVVPVEGE